MTRKFQLPELVFEAEPRARLHRYGLSVTTESTELWWFYKERCWAPIEAYPSNRSTHGPRVRTLRAFKSHLRRHARELAGQKVIWVNRFLGHDVVCKMPQFDEDARKWLT